MRLLLALFAIVSLAAAVAPLYRAGSNKVDGSYIVVYQKNVSVEQLLLDVRFHTQQKVEVKHIYQTTVKGYNAFFTPAQLASVRANPRVAFIEEDQMMHAAQQCNTQNDVDWGLNRVCQRQLNLDGLYKFPVPSGAGVDAYIIDTGVYLQHNDFQGRATFGFKSDNNWSNEDRNGHGTHVASTVGGFDYGVAKRTHLIAVKVLGDNGQGTNAGVIAGVDWAASQKVTSGRPSVGNMSLGGGRSPALNAACDAASAVGLIIVVAAGNNNGDACNGSPSSADDVVCVGSSDIGNVGGNQVDVRSYFSNWGPCVKLFAPGSNILGAWIGSPSATRTISGTSMASPHVAGGVALFIGENPNANYDQVLAKITGDATNGVIQMNCAGACGATQNKMLYNNC